MTMRLTGLTSGLDTESIIQELTSAYNMKTEKYEKQQTKLSWKQDAWKSLNTKIYSLYTNVSNMRFSSAYATKKASVSDATKAKVSVSGTAVNGTHKLNVLSTAQTAYLTGGKLELTDAAKYNSDGSKASINEDTLMRELGFSGSATSFNITAKDENGEEKVTEIKIDRGTSIKEVVAQMKEAGVNVNFDQKNGRIYVNSSKSGADYDFQITAIQSDVQTTDPDGNPITVKDDNADSALALSALGLYSKTIFQGDVDSLPEDEREAAIAKAKEKVAVKLDGQDAEILLDGVRYNNSTNEFSINGLDITAAAVTGEGDENALTISIDTDTQAIYDTVKDFLTEYNTIINEMTKMYNAESSYGYDPLTEDEKSAMSDNEIELWEAKIKDSLLRRDTTLNGVMSAMVNSMAQSYTINGQSYSLSSFGISTLGYLNAAKNEQNAYHIDGDEDDTNTSGKEDKLMTAIKNDPDSVIEFMKQLTTGLYTAIDNKMKSTTLSSAYTVYNDKEMNNQYSEYSKMISKWEDKVSEKEDAYYKQFAAMEAALAKLQSQTNSLTGLFG